MCVLYLDKCDDLCVMDVMVIVILVYLMLMMLVLRVVYDLYVARVDVGDANADFFGEW